MDSRKPRIQLGNGNYDKVNFDVLLKAPDPLNELDKIVHEAVFGNHFVEQLYGKKCIWLHESRGNQVEGEHIEELPSYSTDYYHALATVDHWIEKGYELELTWAKGAYAAKYIKDDTKVTFVHADPLIALVRAAVAVADTEFFNHNRKYKFGGKRRK